MSVVDDIKARIDIIDLVSETVKLRRAGKNYTGFCPFHPNTRTPAFVVFPDSGTWRCFGQCNEGGDVFRYVMKKEGWDFAAALQYLAQRAGVTLEAPTPQRQEENEAAGKLRTLLEDAVLFYRYHLMQDPAGKTALAYLGKRGLTQETIDKFGLGYAPDAWDAALGHFTGHGYSSNDLLDTGLVTERRLPDGTPSPDGGVYDRFRNRIMFPIRDGMGHMTGFGARILNPEDVPKFLNSPQTALFDKGRLLYGLDQARKPIRAQDQVVIVEGYLDVILLHQAGFTNTVSPMGTALTEDQLRMLKRFTRRIVLALDADAAGAKATLRGLEVARQAMDREDEIAFDARGLLHHEARLQADLRVTTIPEGMDPDEVVLRNPEEWRHILEAAQPVVIHVMETLAAGRNLDDPKVKGEIAGQVLPLVEDVPDLVERDAYRQRLARLLRVDERSLIGSRSTAVRPARRSRKTVQSVEKPQGIGETAQGRIQLKEALERHSLCLLLRKPDAVYLLDRSLQKVGLPRFSVEDYEYADHQIIARLILESLEQDRIDGQLYIEQNLPESLQGLMEELRKPLSQGEPTEEHLNDDLLRTIVRLRQERISIGLEQIRFLKEDPDSQSEPRPDAYNELIVQYTQTRDRLDRAFHLPTQLDEKY
jgi:DNA primase